MPGWKIIDTGAASAVENMALDARLLESLASETQPILHLYDWLHPSATFGHFIDPYALIEQEAAEAMGLDLARRPTGGGMIFHLTDFAFSVLMPAAHGCCSLNTLDNYACVNRIVIDIIQRFLGQQTVAPVLLQASPTPADALSGHFCMAKPTIYDVMLDGRKVGGAAQRRTRHGFLHQGTISLALPDFDRLSTLFKPGALVIDSMRKHSFALLGDERGSGALARARQELKQCFHSYFAGFNVQADLYWPS